MEVGEGCRGLSAERKRVNHVCNSTDFPLKWETEVGSVQIYGAPYCSLLQHGSRPADRKGGRVLEEQ